MLDAVRIKISVRVVCCHRVVKNVSVFCQGVVKCVDVLVVLQGEVIRT